METSLNIKENNIPLMVNNPIIATMKRYEVKYILNKEQLDYFKKALVGHMIMDQYGKTSIASIYYDTPDYQIIRASIEKPAYKEKIRLRTYGLAQEGKKVFLELKRKAEGIVYKRRVSLNEDEANNFFYYRSPLLDNDQIAKEITYFRDYYQNLEPKIMIIYDRVAYYDPESDLRLTIDENPRYRTNNLNLHSSMDGKLLLEEGSAILEIKVQQAMPLWLTSALSKGAIYKSSFSKVGKAYEKELLNNQANMLKEVRS